MDDRFYNGILGSETSVAGQRLFALTPWHITILHALDSPLIKDGEELTPGDILLFLRIVQCRYPNRPDDLRPRWRDVFWCWRLNKPRILKRHTIRLKKWLDVQMSAPKLWNVEYSE